MTPESFQIALFIVGGIAAWLLKSHLEMRERVTRNETKAEEMERHTNQRFEDRARERKDGNAVFDDRFKNILEKIGDLKAETAREFAKVERSTNALHARFDAQFGPHQKHNRTSGFSSGEGTGVTMDHRE